MNDQKYENMIMTATSLSQEKTYTEKFFTWFSAPAAACFLFVSVLNVYETENEAIEISVSTETTSTVATVVNPDPEFEGNMKAFNNADDYLLLSSLEF